MHSSPLAPEPIRSVRTIILATALILTLDSGLAPADIIRVPADQPTIQAGINAATAGDEVLVAPGTYTGAGNKNLDFHGQDIVVRSESGPATTFIDCQGSGRGFILLPPLSVAAVVEGFTIENGNGNQGPEGGGGMLILGCSPTIANCVFRWNTAVGAFTSGGGGGLGCFSSHSTIRDCRFEENSVPLGEGGGFVSRFSVPALIGCTFIGNQSRLEGGGALIGQPGAEPATVSHCTFHGNQSRFGGGLSTVQPTLITDSIFTENVSSTNGGGLAAFDASIERCTFRDNVALRAGALEAGGSTIADCEFHHNSASERGGAVWTVFQSSSFQRCIFSENSAPLGGAVAARVPAIFDNCTIVRNTAEVGSGMWIESVAPTLLNSIIVFGVNGEAFHCTVAGLVSCCDIYGNEGGDWVGCLDGELGKNGNISADPLFCDLIGGDFALCADSPCAPPQSTCELIGALPVGCGSCGVTSVEPTTWGGIKHRARSLPGEPVLAK